MSQVPRLYVAFTILLCTHQFLRDCNGNLVSISFHCLVLFRIQCAVSLRCTLFTVLISDLETNSILVESGDDTQLSGILKI